MTSSSKPETATIIGGGITGLAAAWKLKQRSPDTRITILEAAEQFGGVLQTHQISGYLVEAAADMFTCQPPAALELCHELGLDDLLTTTEPKHKAFVGMQDKVVPVPAGFSLMVPAQSQSILDWPLMSESGKQRLLDEVNVTSCHDWTNSDEDFESFAVRRFGQEAFEVLIQPLVSGIYSADPKKLSMKATMKRFVDMEQKHGSLIKAVTAKAASSDAKASGARYNLFRTPKAGFSSLVDALINDIENQDGIEIKTATKVHSISQSTTGRWVANLENSTIESDAMIVTAPTEAAAALMSNFDQLADELSGIVSTSCAVVAMGIDRRELPTNFDGFGIIYPHIDGGSTIAISFSSNKFPHRAPDGKMLLRFFIGGALQESLVDLPDETLVKLALDQFETSLGCRPSPEFQSVFRWKKAMPQYHVGHLDRVSRIESLTAAMPGFELAGKSYRGVGIPACIESGINAVDGILNRSGY